MKKRMILETVGVVVMLVATVSGATRPVQTGGEQPAAGVVNVNTADEVQLSMLPGIGPKLASEIYAVAEGGFLRYDSTYYDPVKGWLKPAPAGYATCDHRCHIRTVDDLLRVKGIGPKKLAALRPFVVLSGKTTATAKIRVTKGGAK